MKKYLKVDSDVSLIRDTQSNTIINNNKSEFEKFTNLSKAKYKEKQEFNKVKEDLASVKNDLEEIKSLLKLITHT